MAYFSEGAKSFFLIFFPGVKCFFPVENSHFGWPKTNFRRFQKWILQFSFFSSQFLPLSLFSLPLFSRYTSAKISRSEVSGVHSAPLPPACYARMANEKGSGVWPQIYLWVWQILNLFLMSSQYRSITAASRLFGIPELPLMILEEKKSIKRCLFAKFITKNK